MTALTNARALACTRAAFDKHLGSLAGIRNMWRFEALRKVGWGGKGHGRAVASGWMASYVPVLTGRQRACAACVTCQAIVLMRGMPCWCGKQRSRGPHDFCQPAPPSRRCPCSRRSRRSSAWPCAPLLPASRHGLGRRWSRGATLGRPFTSLRRAAAWWRARRGRWAGRVGGARQGIRRQRAGRGPSGRMGAAKLGLALSLHARSAALLGRLPATGESPSAPCCRPFPNLLGAGAGQAGRHLLLWRAGAAAERAARCHRACPDW